MICHGSLILLLSTAPVARTAGSNVGVFKAEVELLIEAELVGTRESPALTLVAGLRICLQEAPLTRYTVCRFDLKVCTIRVYGGI